MLYARERLAAAVRMGTVMLVLGLFLATAWVCLMVGAVLYLSRFLGRVEALLTVSGALVVIAALIWLIFKPRRSQARAAHPTVSGDKVLQLITTIVHLGPRQAGAFVLLASVMAGVVGALLIVKGGPKAGQQTPPNS